MTTQPTPTAPTTQLSAAQRVAIQKRVTLRNLFESQKPELSKLLPKTMNPDRLFRMALSECVKNPELLSCSAESWALAMQTCAAQGLYPDSGLGFMYLIPRAGKVTTLRGYQGDIALARKSGELLDIYAEVVHEKDHYKVVKGLDRSIIHEPSEDEDPGALKACYAVAKLRGGEVAFVTLSRRDVERHKRSAQGTDRSDSPWRAHEEQMWKKTAIRELFRWLPKATEEMQEAAREEDLRAGRTIDAAAVSLPVEAAPDQLEELTEKLKGGTQQPQDGAESGAGPRECAHPQLPPSKVEALGPGETAACPDCGTEFRGADREPGADDGDPEPREAVEKLAATATSQQPRRAGDRQRQGRLQEG